MIYYGKGIASNAKKSYVVILVGKSRIFDTPPDHLLFNVPDEGRPSYKFCNDV